MVKQEYINYVRANMDKYPMESIKQGLVQAGATPEEAEEAARLAVQPQAQNAEVTQPDLDPFNPFRMIEQAKQVLFNPEVFFRNMPKKGGYKDPLLFLVFMTIVAQALFLVLNIMISLLKIGGGVGILPVMFSFIAGIFMIPIVFLIVTAIAHVIWMMLGSKEDFETSFRCVAYLSATAPLSATVTWIPFAGPWLSIPVSLYGLYLYVHASVEAHGVKRASALIVAGIFALITAAGSVVSIFSARKLKQLPDYSAAAQAGDNAAKLQQLAENMAKNAQSGQPGTESGAEAPAGEEQAPQIPIPDSAGDQQKQAMEMVNQAMKAGARNKKVEEVDAAELEALLPEELTGMTRGEPSSRSGKDAGYNTSSSGVVYKTRKNRRITVKITDTGEMGALMSAGWNMGAQGSGNKEASFTQYKGFKAKETPASGARGPVMDILVGDRFLVEIKGSAGFNIKNLRYVAGRVDLEKLQTLGK